MASHQELGSSSLAVRPSSRRSFEGWKTVVLLSAVVSGLTFVVNLSLLLWTRGSQSDRSQPGIKTIFTGDCDRTETISLWTHLTINIISTLLLAGSNSTSQCLTAPTRKDLDILHKKGQWMDVGTPSFRNLRWISLPKKAVWILLLVSSVPLHLIFNSMIFSTITSNNYVAIVAPESFLTSPTWELPVQPDAQHTGGWQFSSFNIYDANATFAQMHSDTQSNSNKLQRLEPEARINRYSKTQLSTSRNVLVVVEKTFPTDNRTTYGLISVEAWASYASPSTWTCLPRWARTHPGYNLDTIDTLFVDQCTTTDALDPDGGWRFPAKFQWATDFGVIWAPVDVQWVKVKYCLAEVVTPQCSVKFSQNILIWILVANFVKFACFVTVLLWKHEAVLVTVGDAIKSFTGHPDNLTRGCGTLSISDVRKGVWPDTRITSGNPVDCPPRPFEDKQRRWFAAVSIKRWSFTAFLFLTLLAAAGVFSAFSVNWIRRAHDLSFGRLNPNMFTTVGLSTTRNTLLANTPQILLSLGYVFYNNAITSCLVTSEIADFSKQRKALRVSKPIKGQRSTYWLQVPYRYAMPLMISFGLLHWLWSQSFFYMELYTRDATDDAGGRPQIRTEAASCGLSALAIVISTAVSATLALSLFLLGFRKFPRGMPLIGSCSVAISAACHSSADEGGHMLGRPLQYGVLRYGPDNARRSSHVRTQNSVNDGEVEKEATVREQDMTEAFTQEAYEPLIEQKEGEVSYRRVGFTAWPVDPLVDGEVYI